MAWEGEDNTALKTRLAAGARLVAPADLFETPFRDANEALLTLVCRCEELCIHPFNYQPFFAWLGALKSGEGLAFYGSALTDPLWADDIDLLCLPNVFPPPYHGKPNFVHVTYYNQIGSQNENDADRFFLAGSLLFMGQPAPETIAHIEHARSRILSNPFFDCGIGDLITHAAFKALSKDRDRVPDDFTLLGGVELRVTYQWVDGGMCTNTYSMHEQNEQVRFQMQDLKDEQVYALALAGMRRIRVKEENRKELAERFVKELRRRMGP